MASRIKYEDVKASIESKGWTLVSETYKNLKTDLIVLCPEGHENHITFDDWRKSDNIECEICAFSPIKKVNEKPKKKQGYRILALD